MNDFDFSVFRAEYPYGRLITESVGANLPNNQVGITTATYTGALVGSGYVVTPWPSLTPATMPQIDTNSLDADARIKTVLELKDQKVNLVQAYAERHQTARLFNSSIKRMAKAILLLRAGNLTEAARVLGVKASSKMQASFRLAFQKDHRKAVANMWLELQYGWFPLIKDVQGLIELSAQKVFREVRNKVTKTATRTENSHGVSSEFSEEAFHLVSSVTRKMTIKYVIYYSTSQGIHTLSQVGALNLLYLGWELTPFSFVADWAIPIGNYLNSLDATSGLTFEKGCKTTVDRITTTKRTQMSRVRYQNQGTGTLLSVSGDAVYTEESVNIQRRKLTSLPDVSFPTFKSPFSTIHIANALALLQQSLRFR